MGKKGDKMTPASAAAVEILLDRLSAITGVTSKRMFGGHGIFHEKKMFGLIDSKGQCFLKVTDANRADYEKVDAGQHSRMPYFAPPAEVLEDKKKLEAWVKKAIAASKE